MKIDIKTLGFTPAMQQAAQEAGLCLGRVSSQSHDIWRVLTQNGEITAHISGRLRQNAAQLPVVGDFVFLDDSAGIIHQMLERRSAFVRRSKGAEQIVAANIDTVFICMALDGDFNLRRLERYLSVAWDSGAVPVVVLTKADLCADLDVRREAAEAVALGVDVRVTPDELGSLRHYITDGSTVAFIGSSGVGKSTLVNRLAADTLMATGDTRRDGKGRHTTTARCLLPLGSGCVIDTPGMRELCIGRADLSSSFADVEALAELCRFSNCTHTSEPGCAVLEAVSDGVLASERLKSWQKLRKEAAYALLDSRQIETAKLESMLGPGAKKQMKRIMREKQMRR